MWIAVTPRFRDFLGNLALSDTEHPRGIKRYEDVTASLDRGFFGETGDGLGSVIVGSWGKGTAISPSMDVDVYYRVPVDLYQQYSDHVGNGQSALLATVRDKLLKTYPQTKISADGQIVIVAFNDHPQIEVAPAFLTTNGRYVIPNTNDGGSWIEADPVAEAKALDSVDSNCANNCRPLVRIAKRWGYYCNVPIKSYYLELLVSYFLPLCSWKANGLYYYDWIVRDFFRFLVTASNFTVYAPGTLEAMNVGDAWLSKANSALGRVEKACEYEYLDKVVQAGEEWQKVFGTAIPKYDG